MMLQVPAKRKEPKPGGKKGNPAYAQVTAYIPAKLHLAVKHKLLDTGDDFSTTVEKLLADWVKRK